MLTAIWKIPVSCLNDFCQLFEWFLPSLPYIIYGMCLRSYPCNIPQMSCIHGNAPANLIGFYICKDTLWSVKAWVKNDFWSRKYGQSACFYPLLKWKNRFFSLKELIFPPPCRILSINLYRKTEIRHPSTPTHATVWPGQQRHYI